MRLRLIVGVLAILALGIGFVANPGLILGQEQRQAQPAAVEVGAMHLQVDRQLLARLDEESPRLALLADDGSRALVGLWMAKEALTLNQMIGLAPVRYRTLMVTWPDGTQQDIPIDVDLTPPAI